MPWRNRLGSKGNGRTGHHVSGVAVNCVREPLRKRGNLEQLRGKLALRGDLVPRLGMGGRGQGERKAGCGEAGGEPQSLSLRRDFEL